MSSRQGPLLAGGQSQGVVRRNQTTQSSCREFPESCRDPGSARCGKTAPRSGSEASDGADDWARHIHETLSAPQHASSGGGASGPVDRFFPRL